MNTNQFAVMPNWDFIIAPLMPHSEVMSFTEEVKLEICRRISYRATDVEFVHVQGYVYYGGQFIVNSLTMKTYVRAQQNIEQAIDKIAEKYGVTVSGGCPIVPVVKTEYITDGEDSYVPKD